MSESVTVNVILPPIAATNIERDLLALTEHIWKVKHPSESYFYGLGGEYGYGVDYQNDVFTMWPFYWGECNCGYAARAGAFSAALGDHPSDCFSYRYIAEEQRIRDADMPYWERHDHMMAWAKANNYADAPFGMAVHCTCGRDTKYRDWSQANPHPAACSSMRPNFHHKPSGLEIRWYKWIGRDTEYNRKPSSKEWRRIFRACVVSVTP